MDHEAMNPKIEHSLSHHYQPTTPKEIREQEARTRFYISDSSYCVYIDALANCRKSFSFSLNFL